MHSPPDFRNAILFRLEPDVIRRLQLSPLTLEAGRELITPGEDRSRVLFLETGLASTVLTFADGRQVETNLLGFEAAIGVFKLLSKDLPSYRTRMEIAGTALAAPAELARREFALHGSFYELVVKSVRARIYETMQTAGCNGVHNQQQRFARWLLQCRDRAGSNNVPVSQERMAELLACRPSSISEASSLFQNLGILEQHRGCITILDPVRLEEKSCECIHSMRDALRGLISGSAD